MEPWLEDSNDDDLADDLQSMSFNSTTTTTHRTTSSSSEATFIASSSSHTLGSSLNSTTRHISNHSSLDPCWDAIHTITRSQTIQQQQKQRSLAFTNLRFLCRLGSGDIGLVYLIELLRAEGCLFAAKVMDRKELAKQNKGGGVTDHEILECLDHSLIPKSLILFVGK